MKNYNKGFIVPFLLTIIAILVVGGGAYIYLNQNQSKIAQTVLTNLSTTTSPADNVIVPTVVIINSLNGSFIGTDTWITTDMAGRKWTINYKDAQFFNRHTSTGEILGNLNIWLSLVKKELIPGNEGPGPHLPVKVIGTIKDGVLYASKIIQTIQ